MANWLMGALAAQDQYDPEEGAYQAELRDAAQPYRGFPRLDAGQGGGVRAPGSGVSPQAGAISAVPGAVMGALMDIVKRPGQQMAKNPYPPGSEEADWFEDQRARNATKWGSETALDLIGGGPALGAKTGAKAGEVALGVVPVDAARAFGIKPAVQNTDLLQAALKSHPGAVVDDGMLRIRVARGQRPEQEMMDSVRGGVFYLPEGEAAKRYMSIYKRGGTSPNFNYGGPQLVSGETAFANPLLAKGATGGKVPEAVYNQLLGDKKAIKALDADTMEVVNAGWMDRGNYGTKQRDMVERFLEKHAPELVDNAEYILANSKKGNQLRYALQEAAIGSLARGAGHDAIIGYSASRTRPPKLSEVFDVRERSYPSPSGDFDVWPRDLFRGAR